MVVLRRSAGSRRRSLAAMDSSSEFLSLQPGGRRTSRQRAALAAVEKAEIGTKKKEYNTVTRTLRSRAGAKTMRRVHGENRDLELRRSCRVRRSRYSTTNSSILFDKLITNLYLSTAEVVLQKMDEMEQMRRCQRCWEDVEENLDIFT
ncbi:ATPase family AAA domain-containing protein 2-like [Anas platyrhynchos]|uniref:ATPase family AAA domain-containing protein 2-like n=1 Tax=Anas platyrhynchos TaxID=8839 RepID=UPI003AF2DADD